MNRAARITYSFFGPLTPMAKLLIGINVVAFTLFSLARSEMQGAIVQLLGLTPAQLSQNMALWQPLTYLFLHSGFLHLLFNMLCVWWFGSAIEAVWGGANFLRFYFFCGIGAALTHLALRWNSEIPVVGASGAVFGLLFGYGMLFPDREILFMFLWPLKAKYFVALVAAIEFFGVLSSSGAGSDPVARLAHLGGLFFAALWFFYYRTGPRQLRWAALGQRWPFRRRRPHLELVRPEGAGAEEEGEPEPEEEKPPTIH
jgi:membrane associated rhomboid family serine protease